jgi:hypothetical protein
MSNYYGDVVVTLKERLRLDVDIKGKLTKEKVLEKLRKGTFNDITDTETFDYIEVLEIDELEKQ